MDREENKPGVCRWLVSLSEYYIGLLGLRRGVCSSECLSSFFG